MPVGHGLEQKTVQNIYVPQSNLPDQNLLWMKIPHILVPKRFQTGIKALDVKMPGLNDALYQGQDFAWAPGGQNPRSDDYGELNLRVGADYRATKTKTEYSGEEAAGGEPYVENIKNNQKILMDNANMAIELHTLSEVHNTTKNNVLTFGGIILEDNTEFEFLAQLRAGIREFKKICRALGLKTCMFVDSESLRIMSSQKDCTGAGSPAAGIRSDFNGSMDQFKSWLKGQLGIDEIEEYESTYSDALAEVSGWGETFNFSPRGISFHGIDRTKKTFNMSARRTDNEVCGGTLALAVSRYPKAFTWDYGPEFETKKSVVRYARRVLNPLYDATREDGTDLLLQLAVTIPPATIYNVVPT